MLVQVDGTPYDWFGSGDARVLHLAVDDATTEVLSGCFMPIECMRGYARMAELEQEHAAAISRMLLPLARWCKMSWQLIRLPIWHLQSSVARSSLPCRG